jgi:hypothetical protein
VCGEWGGFSTGVFVDSDIPVGVTDKAGAGWGCISCLQPAAVCRGVGLCMSPGCNRAGEGLEGLLQVFCRGGGREGGGYCCSRVDGCGSRQVARHTLHAAEMLLQLWWGQHGRCKGGLTWRCSA